MHEARKIREDLHRHPELSLHERRTFELIVEKLRGWHVDVAADSMAKTGVIGLIHGKRSGRTVALRAEMDALPIQENTKLPYSSIHPGIMHACGHDGHMAILLATAKLLSKLRNRFRGAVKLVFQPAEENGSGAKKMIRAGLLEHRPKIDAVFALHARPQVGVGRIELDSIPSASSDVFEIMVQGRGCHAAYPHLGTDPIVIGSHIVNALQQIVSRNVAPYHQAVVTVGCFQAGSRSNVIPDEAFLKGTIRTRHPQVRSKICKAVRRIAVECARALGAEARVKIKPGCHRVKNNPDLMNLVRKVGVRVLGAKNVLEARLATMGSEDFSYYLEEQGGVPGCLFRLGTGGKSFVHTPTFDFGHVALEPGILMMTNVAIQYLAGERS